MTEFKTLSGLTQSKEAQPAKTGTPPVPEPPKPRATIEEDIGAKWFARVGVIVLLLGISFFLKYAFDNDWVPPGARVILGVAVGAIMLFLGEKTRAKYFAYSQLLSGGGLSIMYLSLYAAYDYYDLITQGAAFVALALITAGGIGLAVRLDAKALAVMSVLGALLTPVLVSSGQDNQAVLFTYLIVLDLGVLAASVFKHWPSLHYVSLAGTFLLFTGWYGNYYDASQLKSTFFFLTMFFFIYSVALIIHNLVERKKSSGIEQVGTLILGVLYFSFSYGLLEPEFHRLMGLFALTLAAYYYMGAHMVRISTPEDDSLYFFLSLLAVASASLAVPLQFEQATITIAWAIEAALLFALGAHLGKRGITGFGLAVYVLAFCRYLFVDISQSPAIVTPVLNKAFLAAAFLAAASAASAWFFYRSQALPEKSEDWFNKKKLVAAMVVAANLLVFFAGNREITNHYNSQAKQARDNFYLEQRSVVPGNGYEEGHVRSQQLADKLAKIKSRSSIALSLFWIMHAVLALAAGFAAGSKGLRVGGILLLSLAVLKLFFYDLWNLGTLYRIISTMTLGIVLLSISFAYQKYKDKIKQIF